jgi:hypothetical protein
VSLLSKLLARQNKHNIRIVAYEVLLQFIDILVQDGNLSGLDDSLELFAKAFNMAPFSAEMPEARIRYQPPAVDPMLALVPSPAPENIEESCTFLDVFFDFLTQRTGKVMDFWFEQLRRFYLSQLFPKVFVDLKVIQNDGTLLKIHTFFVIFRIFRGKIRVICEIAFLVDSYEYLLFDTCR